MNKQHESIIFNAAAAARYMLLFPLAELILVAVHLEYHIIPAILVVAPYLVVLLVPLLFTRSVRDLFSTRVVLDFTDDHLIITEYNLKNGTLLRTYSISWADINSYQYYDAGKGDIVNLKLYFNNGRSRLLKFRGENILINEAMANEDSLFMVVHSFTKSYNSRSNDHKIYFRKFFMMTAGGAIFTWVIPLGFAAIALILFALHKKAPFIWLVPGLVITPTFITLKKKQTATYQKIIALG